MFVVPRGAPAAHVLTTVVSPEEAEGEAIPKTPTHIVQIPAGPPASRLVTQLWSPRGGHGAPGESWQGHGEHGAPDRLHLL